MILTDKAKEDFEIWYLKKVRSRPDVGDRYFDENILTWFEISDDTLQTAYLIEWFDAVKINIHTDITSSYYIGRIYVASLDIPDFSEKYYHNISRNDVCKELIKKGNQIYNSRS